MKRKAETRVAQIKKQLQDEKDATVGELNGNQSKLQEELLQLQDGVQNVEKVIRMTARWTHCQNFLETIHH